MLHQIGAGTLGPVFRAYDAKQERLVAVKLFRLDLTPERVTQLVGEFDRLIASELGHPSLVAPIASGISGGTAYLAVEYVNAESLDLALREYGPAPAEDAVRVVTQLAAALDFASAVQVNHGAMHPRDILLSADETRITGIGVARALERVGVSAPVRRPYSAPERVAGTPWDRRADVFALAALSHELLWGRRIAGTGQQVAGSLAALPGGRTTALQDAFARALSEDPDDRFETSLEFAEALRAAFETAAGHATNASIAESTSSTTSAPVADSEARLPLDPLPVPSEPAQAPPPSPMAAEIAPVPEPPPARGEDRRAPAAEGPQLDLHAPQSARFRDVEPAAEPRVSARPPEPIARERPIVAAATARPAPVPRTSLFWPVAAALVAGAVLGFVGGLQYLSGGDFVGPGETTATPSGAAPATDGQMPVETSSAREATDVAVESPRPIAAQGKQSTPAEPAPSLDAVEPPPSAPPPAAPAERSTAPRRPAPAPARSTGDDAPTAASGTVGGFVGRLSVESRPAGARVFLDGRLIGTTPLSVRSVRAGEHAIRLERDGYRRWSSSIRVVAAEQNRVTASLER